MPAVARTCPLCKRKDIKYLSAHLKNKHKLVDAKERAPLLKRSLERSDVKRKDTVLAENDSANDVFYEQERVLGASFKQIEDQIVELRLQALQTEYSAISEQCFRLEIRAKLLPLYGMIMKSLETLLLPVTTQTKREDATPSKHSEEALSETDEAKKKDISPLARWIGSPQEWTRTLSTVQVQLGWKRTARLSVQ